MRVSIVAAVVLLVAGCGSNDPSESPSTSAATSSATTTTVTTAALSMRERWEREIRSSSTRDRCSTEKAFTPSCVAAMENLSRVTTILAKNAPADGSYTNAALAALEAGRAADKWAGECVKQQPEDRLRNGCLQALTTANNGDEAVLSELNVIQQTR